jgi:hypothetical protein
MSRTRIVLVSLVFFAILFTAIAILQYWFVRHKLRQTVGQQLDYWADDLSTTLNHGNQLDVAALRRTAPEASAFVILASDGTVIETRGFIKGSIIYAAFPAGIGSRSSRPGEIKFGRKMECASAQSDGWLGHRRRIEH